MNRWISFYLAILWAVLVPTTAQARYLNPNTGRFQTMDSYEGDNCDPLSLHKYLYATDNPVNRIDPSGRFDTGTVMGTLVASAIAGTLAATAIVWSATALFSAHAFNETMEGQREYKDLAQRLGGDVKVSETACYNELERGNAPSVPGIDTGDNGGGDYYFLHGSSTALWKNQVRVKPVGGGDFGQGFYTLQASLPGLVWGAKRAFDTTRERGGYPFVLVLKMEGADYESVMSDALDVRGNQAVWRQTVIDLYPQGSSGHPVVVGPLATGNRSSDPRQVAGPDQFKWESAGRGVKMLKPVMIVPVLRVGYYGE